MMGIQLGEDRDSCKLVGNLLQSPSVLVGSLDYSVDILWDENLPDDFQL